MIMAAGGIILGDGTAITEAEIEQIAAAVKDILAKESKDPAQYELVNSLANLTTLPALLQNGSVYRLVRVAVDLLKGLDGRDGKEISLRKTDTAIQWQLGSDGWIDLIQLDDFKGTQGDIGKTGAGVYVEQDGTTVRFGQTASGETNITWGSYTQLRGADSIYQWDGTKLKMGTRTYGIDGSTDVYGVPVDLLGATGKGFAYQWDGTSLQIGVISAGGETTEWGEKIDLKGERGEQGLQGLQGIQGEQGLQGETGLTGQGLAYRWNGTSLQLAAIPAGTTDEVWGELVNLKGEQGIQGIQGEQGIQGIQGIQGDKGVKGTSFAYKWDGTSLSVGTKEDGEDAVFGEPVNLKGEQGNPFTYSDFTSEQIEDLKRPATEAAEVALSLSKNLPKIQESTWRIYNATTKEYEDSGVDATGRPPIIQTGTWWLWDYNTGSYKDSGQSVSSEYKAYVPRVYPNDVDLSTLSTYEEDGEIKEFINGSLIYVENELEPTGYSLYIYTPHGSGYAWVKIILITDDMHLILVKK